MHDADRFQLLFGPYAAPRLRRGDWAICLYKDCDVVVTGWTDARISWPRCRPLDVPRSHPSLLVNEELARAIQHESAAAIRHWWGVSVCVVWRWRKALGVGRTDNEGSARLMRAAAEKGGEAFGARGWTPEERERLRQVNARLGLAKHLVLGYHGPRWAAWELALLGTVPDREVAWRTGRSVDGVRQKRMRVGIANPHEGRRDEAQATCPEVRTGRRVMDRGVGRRLFTDGIERNVHEDAEGRQYVLGPDGERVCGHWLPPADEPAVVESQNEAG
jgi:hypothetical protein